MYGLKFQKSDAIGKSSIEFLIVGQFPFVYCAYVTIESWYLYVYSDNGKVGPAGETVEGSEPNVQGNVW